MNFSEKPPSKEWATLKYQGKPIAEVWIKPEGEPYALTFRIPHKSFHIPGLGPLLTTENLLKTVGLTIDEVESCRQEGVSPSSIDPRQPLSPPEQDAPFLTLSIRLKQPPQPEASGESADLDIPESKWQDFEARWNAILSIEASMDTLRLSMESVRSEMENASRKALSTEEKLHAFNADVAQWNKAKSRVVYALPKAKEFIHRSTWAKGAPERKKLEELFENNIRPRIPFPQMDKILDELENLLKDRQVLYAHGVSVQQECKSITADVQGTLRTLQGNAMSNAAKKRGAAGGKGKFF